MLTILKSSNLSFFKKNAKNQILKKVKKVFVEYINITKYYNIYIVNNY